MRADIKSMDVGGIAEALSDLGEPRYRASQVLRWLYARGATSFDEMTDLPAGLRAALAERFAMSVPRLVERQVSRDGARKYLWRLADGVTVESVGIPADERLTVCFSTQAGCRMGCAFCATGRGGFIRDLSPGEMADQVAMAGRDFGRRVANAVAMGQGEPFANYEATLAALRILNSPDALGIGARHITVSTCGLPPAIRRFAREPEQFTLAVSLHSAVQETRDRLMPGVRGVRLEALRESLVSYVERTGRRPSLEYALLAGVNDTPEELAAVLAFCRGLLVHVNLIPANVVNGCGFDRSSARRAREFLSALTAAGVEASIRAERGADIDAACGQLRQRREGGAEGA
ncbi:MAG: 23S rRNA (adenine(2503)-C(2))-methyltransferase RlmN [Coriobacteriia bacterium]|nr:23S rRNA (adenine(2503)-C(2))-methyltransferase RlmN [Coriobacteriia bacterium]